MHAAARTTSMLASAALLGALAIAGLTMGISFTPPAMPDPPGITVTDEPPAPPPPIFHPHTPPPPQANQEATDTTTVPFDPPLHIDAISTDPGADTGPVIPTIMNPHWVRRPANLQAYYPRRALQRSVEGVVQLDCRVLTSGNLQCTVISETPSGWDFGAAAQRIAADHRMTPAMRDGVPVEGRYQMRVPFRLN